MSMRLFKLRDDEGERWLVSAADASHAKSFVEQGERRVVRCEAVPEGRGVNTRSIDPEMTGRVYPGESAVIVCASCVY